METSALIIFLLITFFGSYRGTGQAIAQTLLAEGATVLIHGLNADQAHAAVEELGGGIPVTGDISTGPGCDALIQDCAPYPVQILINNYGGADTDDLGQARTP